MLMQLQSVRLRCSTFSFGATAELGQAASACSEQPSLQTLLVRSFVSTANWRMDTCKLDAMCQHWAHSTAGTGHSVTSQSLEAVQHL